MAEKAAYSLKSNAARLGQRFVENISESSRDLGLIDSFASGSGGGSGKYLENGAVLTSAGVEETKRMLSSRREVERDEGLKRVIAMMTKSLPVTSFFPLIASLLTPTTSAQSRTLISLFIIHCATTSPSLALLAINSYQKDLSDPNPVVRAGAIKTLSSMGLEDIRSLVGVAVEKGARDGSWYVRRASAEAIISLWRADKTYDNRSRLLPSLTILLTTASPLTIGSALSAWEEICPMRWDLIHPGYRKWCKMLMDVEEWGQCVLLRILLRYARTFFLEPLDDSTLDSDLELALRASEALLQHLNPAVVSAVIKLYYYAAPPNRVVKIIRPLLRLLSGSPEVQIIALRDCAVIADERPHLLSEHIAEFYVRLTEPLISKRLRLRILVALANEKNVKVLLSEFLVYVKDGEDTFSAEAISAIGTCARVVPAITEECLKTLLQLSQSANSTVVTQSILVLRSLLRSSKFPSSTSRSVLIQRLVALLETQKLQDDTARASVFWLVGQFAEEGLLESVAPDLVRLGAQGFKTESEEAKLQILTLSAKVLVLSHLSTLTPHLRTLSLLFTYLITLARYDLIYQVRDRARFLKGLLSSGGVGLLKEGQQAKLGLSEEDFRRGVMVEDLAEEVGGIELIDSIERTMTSEQVRKVLFEGKEAVIEDSTESTSPAELGTFGLSLPGKRLAFSYPLPSFPSAIPPSSIRDVFAPDSYKSMSGSHNASSSSPSRSAMRGFGSETRGLSGSGRSTPVVLVPTHFANGSPEEERNFSGGVPRGGFVDLEDFYGSEEDEEEDQGEEDKEESEEQEESEEEEAEEESSSGEEEEVGEGGEPSSIP